MWYYNNQEFDENLIANHVGFIYLITELSTGKKYIGQKVFYNKVAKKPLKGKKNRRINTKESDWRDYYGSNEELLLAVQKNGVENYKREILRLCSSKSEMNYWETWEIYNRHALLRDDYFNNWVSCRVNRNQLRKAIINAPEGISGY